MPRRILTLAIAGVLLSAGHASAATITDYATRLTGQPTPVHCQPMRGENKYYLGFTLQSSDADGTSTMGPDIYLAAPLCYALSLAIAGQPGDPANLATALEVLTHEATHITLNSGNESTVECNAMLRIDATIRLFGLAANLKQLHALAWQSFWQSPPDYTQDPVCRAHTHDTLSIIGPVAKPPTARGGHASTRHPLPAIVA